MVLPAATEGEGHVPAEVMPALRYLSTARSIAYAISVPHKCALFCTSNTPHVRYLSTARSTVCAISVPQVAHRPHTVCPFLYRNRTPRALSQYRSPYAISVPHAISVQDIAPLAPRPTLSQYRSPHTICCLGTAHRYNGGAKPYNGGADIATMASALHGALRAGLRPRDPRLRHPDRSDPRP
eukprot:1291343-Rhodomonas_salina.1